jgi:hypothetical protein
MTRNARADSMKEDKPDNKAIVVFTQAEIATAIDGFEQAGIEMDDEKFREVYGDVYRKLHAVKNKGGDNEYRVK